MNPVTNDTLFTNKRLHHTKDSSLGLFMQDGDPIGFVIEDEPRVVKVMSETRIPAGTYQLKINQQLTPLTKKYRNKYPWFEYHIELEDVPGFTSIYIHIGNKESHTAGCQLLNSKAKIIDGEFQGEQSTVLFIKFYRAVYEALEKGYTVYYQIID